MDKPLAAMLPSKYSDVDVRELYPDFRPDKALRFSRFFGPGKLSSLPQVWRGVKKNRRSKRSGSTSNETLPVALDTQATQYASDDEDKFLKSIEETTQQESNNNTQASEKSQKPPPAPWRFGPAQYWYDMLNVPESGEGFDYGFKLKAPSPEREEQPKPKKAEEKTDVEPRKEVDPNSGFPDDAFLMISQVQWEDDVIWDGSQVKDEVLARQNSTCNAAGWVPTLASRTAQQFTHTKPATATSANKRPDNAANGEANTSYSMLSIENEELVYGNWEDEVIWDAQNMPKIPKPKILTLDPNDENIILSIPDDVDPSKITREKSPAPKVKIVHPHGKKTKILLSKVGVINALEENAPPPPPKLPDRDPFNISNDIYYQPKSENSRLKVGGGQLIQHSTPVVELRAPFIQTHMGPARLRAFHRPPMRKLSYGPLAAAGPHPVQPLLKHMRKKAKEREAERLASGGGDIFFMRTPEDLSGRDGELVLMEFSEEHPPLISQVGMCSKIKNYYKPSAVKDDGPKPLKYGEVEYAHTSPFLGIMAPGVTQPVIENNMYRAPIYNHPLAQNDFLVIRTRQGYYIRDVDALFVAGQECPLYEVPGPNSKRANNFVRDFLQVFIYRLFWKSHDKPRRIKIDDIKKAFPSYSESAIRKRLKLCSDFKRTGFDSNWWVIKPDFRLPSEDEIRDMVSPEQCCAYFSMAAAEQRLKDAGYGEKTIFTPQKDDDEEIQSKMEDEVKVTPWNTTRAYIQAMAGKCLLQVTGPADPTGCGEGFSYVRVSIKPTQQPNEEQQPKRTLKGTDADLRRLSLSNAQALLRNFGVPEEEIKKLSRWEVIDVVRTLSTVKAKVGEEGATKFSRGNRFSIAGNQERYHEECQRIFELQNRVLTSSEVLSTDEAESSMSEESDLEEMGKNLEKMLMDNTTTEQLSLESEEAERADLRKLLMEETEEKPQVNQTDQQQSSSQGRVLRIVRTFRNASGETSTRVELVRNEAVIDAYMKVRSSKDDTLIRQFATVDDEQKEKIRREKRRIQDQLRRIKRNQEKQRLGGQVTVPPSLPEVKPRGCSLSKSLDLGSPTPIKIPTEQTKTKPEVQTPSSQRSAKSSQNFKPDLKLKKSTEDLKRRGRHSGGICGLGSEVIALGARNGFRTISDDKRPADRRRTDPLVTLSSLLKDVLHHLKDLPDVQPFLYPVTNKVAPEYYRIVTRPMDLQTIRDNLRLKNYKSREQFLVDVHQIVENSTLYTGSTSRMTMAAQRMLQQCVKKLTEKEEELMKLEKQINPLLDDNEQFGEHVKQLETNINGVQQKPPEKVDHLDSAFKEPPTPQPSSEKKRARPKKHKSSTCTAPGAPPSKRSRTCNGQNSLVEDLRYSDSGSSELDEVEQKVATEVMVQLPVPPYPEDDVPMDEPSYDTSHGVLDMEQEVPNELPFLTEDFVDYKHCYVPTDFSFPLMATFEENPMDQHHNGWNDIPIDSHMMDNAASIPPPQFEEKPQENWQPDPAVQDDLHITDSEEEREGLWF